MAIVYRWPGDGQNPNGVPSGRVAIYERAASDSAASLQRQEEAIRAYVADHPQWRVVAVYRDAGSSAFQPPERRRALRSAQDDEFDGLVVHSVDRLARRIDDLIATLRRASVTPHSVTEPLDSATNPGQLFADFPQACTDFTESHPYAVTARLAHGRMGRRHRPLRRGRRKG